MISIPFGGQYKSDSLVISNQITTNCYVNTPQTESFSQANLFGTTGIDLLGTTGIIKQSNRGSHVKAGKLYMVNGEVLYRVDYNALTDNYTNVELGEVSGTVRCSFADNGTQLMVLVPGGDAYIVNEDSGTPFQQITAGGFTANGNPQYVEFVDSFFICTTDSKKFIKSDPNNGLVWNALDFASAESDPDNIVGLVVNRNKLYIAGSETIEEFQNLGLGGFPFQRTGLFLSKGVFAPQSMINIGDTFMWVGGGTDEGAAIWMLNGSSSQKVSTTAIDTRIQKFSNSDIATCFTYSFSKDGQFFVGFTFPDLTIEYNLTSGMWHERRSYYIDSKGATIDAAWRVSSISTAYGKTIGFDSIDGRYGEIKTDYYTEYGNPIIRKFSTFTIFNDESSFTVPEVELTMESGVGNSDEPDPTIRLSTSKDAKKFNNPISRKMGRIGEFNKRQVWSRLGRFPRLCVMLFEYSAPCKFVVVRLGIRVKGGRPHGN